MPANISHAAAKLHGAGHVAPSVARFQTAWRGTRIARHVAPQNHQHYRHRLTELASPPDALVSEPTDAAAIAWLSKTIAKHCINTCTVLVSL